MVQRTRATRPSCGVAVAVDRADPSLGAGCPHVGGEDLDLDGSAIAGSIDSRAGDQGANHRVAGLPTFREAGVRISPDASSVASDDITLARDVIPALTTPTGR